MQMQVQITERFISLVPSFVLTGITDVQEMDWCLEQGLTPDAILTAVAKGIRNLKEMARLFQCYERDEPLLVDINPFRLAGTIGIYSPTEMQINECLLSQIPSFVLIGITDVREMSGCLEQDLTPDAILTAVAKGIRNLEEMVRLVQRFEDDEPLVDINPFRLAGTSGIHNADDPDTIRYRLYGRVYPGED